MNVKLEVLPAADAPVMTALKLVNDAGLKLVYSARHEESWGLSLIPAASGNGHKGAVVLDLSDVPATSSWDAAAQADRSFSVIYSVMGSAISQIAFQNSRQAPGKIVNQTHPFQTFGSAHFVKHEERNVALPVTAIAATDRPPRVVLFSREANGTYGDYRRLEARHPGRVQAARLIRYPAGYLLFSQTGEAGAVRPARSGNGLGGLLFCTRLDDSLRAVEPASEPLGDRIVFEFDADVDGKRIAIFATTAKGYLLAAFDPAQQGPAKWIVTEQPTEKPLSSPSILIVDSTIHVAAIQSAGSHDAQVVMGAATFAQ